MIGWHGMESLWTSFHLITENYCNNESILPDGNIGSSWRQRRQRRYWTTRIDGTTWIARYVTKSISPKLNNHFHSHSTGPPGYPGSKGDKGDRGDAVSYTKSRWKNLKIWIISFIPHLLMPLEVSQNAQATRRRNGWRPSHSHASSFFAHRICKF